MIAEQGDADARTALLCVALNRIRCLEGLQCVHGDAFGALVRGIFIAVEFFHQDDEFVAAKARYGVGFPDGGAQSSRGLMQQNVAVVVSEQVVDVPEVVEIDEHQGAET
jgi:hypothetical protein